ncbi:LysM peptidoglycan-binding domain-containing protein [bacterium]|nr:LysM peptidoglycan-binding domain-containing protein [bacterium]
MKVPPVTGLIHQVTKDDTLTRLSKKYDTPEEKIINQNLLGT